MRQPGQIYKINAFRSGKLKQAEKIIDKLSDVINSLTHLKYEKGTRDGDFALREKLKVLMYEIESHYKTIRSFSSGKIGETDVFKEILTFYGEHFLDDFQLGTFLAGIRHEIANQKIRDHEHNIKKAGNSYERKINLYARDLERDLNEWEKILSLKAVPLLTALINEINDLVLFFRVDDILDSLIIDNNVFVMRGDVFEDFNSCIAEFVRYYIKNRKIFLSDRDIGEMIDQTLNDMGFMSIILKTKNMNQTIFTGIVNQIISKYSLKQLAGGYKQAGDGSANGTGRQDKQSFFMDKEFTIMLEKLCFMEHMITPGNGDRDGYEAGLAEKPDEQFLFYSPGTFDLSLKYIAEYLRDALIFIIDWLNKELTKDPKVSKTMDPVLFCVADINNFISTYKRALEIASIKSNRSEASVISREKQFVSKNMANELIEIIIVTSTNIQDALINTALNAGSISFYRGVLTKKIKIIQDSFNNTFERIKKGLEKI